MARVLIVEDDPDIRDMVEAMMRQIGHRVVAVGSGTEALAALVEGDPPDVAVLDVRMPGMTGLELLTKMRADPAYASIPAVFLSGRVQKSDIAAGRALGATYLTKPVLQRALLRAIAAALEPAETAVADW